MAKIKSGSRNVLEKVEGEHWNFSLRMLLAEKPDYLIAVENSYFGNIDGYFNIVGVYKDGEYDGWVRFKLIECTKKQKADIDTFIEKKNNKLGKFTTKKYYEKIIVENNIVAEKILREAGKMLNR